MHKDIVNQFLPGAYTLIFKKKSKSNLSSLVSLKLKTLAIRIPQNEFCINLVNELGSPMITTSVNIHKEDTLNSIEAIYDKFSSINIFKENHDLKHSLGSTILDCSNKKIKILRKGDGLYPL